MVEFSYIDSASELDLARRQWECINEFGVDLECENNLHYYGAYVSLIQISSRQHNWVVDVLKLGDITPVIQLLEDPEKQKVFHDPSFDLRILCYQFGCRPKNIFDTQLAAVFLGYKELGLAALLEANFGVKKEQRFQLANWTRRPIPKEMLEYAVKDTVFLLDLRDILKKRLQEIGRLGWLEEELSLLDKKEFIFEEMVYSDFPGYGKFNDTQRGILKNLFLLRDSVARELNRPPYFILNRRRMTDIILHPPKSIQEWRNMRGVHPVVRERAQAFFEAVEEGKKAPVPLPKPKKKHFLPKEAEVIGKLSELRDALSLELNIPKNILLSREQMQEIALSKEFFCLRRWQRSLIEPRFSSRF